MTAAVRDLVLEVLSSLTVSANDRDASRKLAAIQEAIREVAAAAPEDAEPAGPVPVSEEERL